MKTKVVRIPLENDSVALDQQIIALCEVHLAAGFRLAASFTFGSDLVLIFQSVA